jgi:cytoskeletal protein RodZ
MLQESSKESGTRLARDMRRIREARHLTVQDLHEETKIPQGLIEAFEESALFDHPQFNRVYLRSFVRTYAQVVGIEADHAIGALEEALANRYAGSLAVEYLGEAPVKAAEIEVRKETLPPEEEAAAELEDVSEPKRKTRDRSPTKRPSPRKSGAPAREEPRGPNLLSTTADTAAGYERVQEEGPAAEDWTSQSPPRGVKIAAGSPREFRNRRGSSRGWMIAAGAIVIFAAAVWALTSLVGDSDEGAETQPAADTVAIADTLARAPVNILPAPPLGDSMNVRIIAANDKVDPIRITVDEDLRRPYWLNLGDSISFRPTDRIEGVEYPTHRRDELGRLVVTRDSVQQYFARRTSP